MKKKSEMDSFASEYAMSGADNALSREEINQSVLEQEKTHADALINEVTQRQAMENEIERKK